MLDVGTGVFGGRFDCLPLLSPLLNNGSVTQECFRSVLAKVYQKKVIVILVFYVCIITRTI